MPPTALLLRPVRMASGSGVRDVSRIVDDSYWLTSATKEGGNCSRTVESSPKHGLRGGEPSLDRDADFMGLSLIVRGRFCRRVSVVDRPGMASMGREESAVGSVRADLLLKCLKFVSRALDCVVEETEPTLSLLRPCSRTARNTVQSFCANRPLSARVVQRRAQFPAAAFGFLLSLEVVPPRGEAPPDHR